MPALGGIIGGVLLWIAARLVTRVLVALGVGVFVFMGIDALLTSAETYIVDAFNALPADVLAVAKIMQMGVCLKMVVSASSIRLTLQGLTEGSILKMFVGARSI